MTELRMPSSLRGTKPRALRGVRMSDAEWAAAVRVGKGNGSRGIRSALVDALDRLERENA